ncbi:hypothetical protein DV735_g340, partial [Chaetothyriales sp. CBS 134920]
MPQPSRRGGRSSTRRLTPQSPAKSALPPGPGRDDPAGLDTAQSLLSPVAEGVPSLPDEIDESAPPHAPNEDTPPSDSQELAGLNYDLILDSLSDLRDEAVKLLNNFHRNDRDDLAACLRTLQDPAAPSTRLCLIALDRLLATHRAFGPHQWALPPIIVRKLKHGQPWLEVADGMWRPDAILYLANLAQLVAGLALPEAPDRDRDALLEDAVAFHPLLFSSTEPGNRFTSPAAAAMLRIGDALRTQYFLSEASKELNREASHELNREAGKELNHPAFNPRARLAEIFSDNDYEQRIEPLLALVPSYASDLELRLEQISAAFPQNNMDRIGIEIGIANLKAAFPWDDFVLEITTWALQREQELLALIEAQDAGIEGIINAIRSANFNIAANPVRRANATTSTGYGLSKTTTRARRGGRGGRGGPTARDIAELKRDQADLAARLGVSANLFENQDEADAATALMAYTQNHDNNDTGGYAPVQQLEGDDGLPVSAQRPPPPSPTQAAEIASRAIEVGSGQANRQNASRTITKSFMDQQPNAQRLTWPADSQPESSAPRPSGTRKRLLSVDSTSYRDINTKAKANVALTRERDHAHIIQQRQPYSEAEVRRLIELVGLNQGPKYAKILKDDEVHPDGPLLQRRTQVQLKDKARNIKMDYLKARQPLPEGFAAVSIGQRLVNVLRSMGIELVDGQPESLLPPPH